MATLLNNVGLSKRLVFFCMIGFWNQIIKGNRVIHLTLNIVYAKWMHLWNKLMAQASLCSMQITMVTCRQEAAARGVQGADGQALVYGDES